MQKIRGLSLRATLIIFAVLLLAAIGLFIVARPLNSIFMYNSAAAAFAEGNYARAGELFKKLGGYRDSFERASHSDDWYTITVLEQDYANALQEQEYIGTEQSLGSPQMSLAESIPGDISGDMPTRARLLIERSVTPEVTARAADTLSKMDDDAWNGAAAENTNDAYLTYLSVWIDGKHRVSADGAIEELFWSEVILRSSLSDYQAYAEKYPNGAHAAEANLKIDEIEWESISRTGDLLAYKEYLVENPNGARAASARAYIAAEHDSDFKTASTANTITSYMEFLSRWPDTSNKQEIEGRIASLAKDRSLSATLLSHPDNADSATIERFLTDYPGHVDEEQVLALLTRNDATISELLSRGVITATGTGLSITHTILTISNNSKLDANVTVPIGTYFVSDKGSVQNMAVREQIMVFAAAGESTSVSVPSVCLNIRRSIPGNQDSFSVRSLDEGEHLSHLIFELDAQKYDFAVFQAAIWIMTDNPGDDAIKSSLLREDGTPAISDAAIALAKETITSVIHLNI